MIKFSVHSIAVKFLYQSNIYKKSPLTNVRSAYQHKSLEFLFVVNLKTLSLDIVKAVLYSFSFLSALSYSLLCFTRWNTGRTKVRI